MNLVWAQRALEAGESGSDANYKENQQVTDWEEEGSVDEGLLVPAKKEWFRIV